LRLQGSTFIPRRDDLIINWGSSVPYGRGGIVLNTSDAVATAANKLWAFNRMQEAGVNVPDFWQLQEEIPAEAYPVFCRTVLNGHSGVGIVVANSAQELVNAPLYVRYVPKQDEYRVHVVRGRVVAVQRKARRLDVDDPNWQIRNHANGFVFARDGVDAPNCVLEHSIAAVDSLGLDFGGVDVIWNDRRQMAYVLEVNTACGLEGQTVQDYAQAFQAISNEIN
jgi:glutathione synthase/RimK-type ligase-like ATP-grasp enzyme